MEMLNLAKYKSQIKEQEAFLNSVIVYNRKEILVKTLLMENLKENIPLGKYSTQKGIEVADDIVKTLKEIKKDFKLFYDIHDFNNMPESLQKKAGFYVVAEGMQNEDPFWKYSKHKNIVYWWLLSDGTLVAENESEKYGLSYISRKFKQFEINGAIFDFLKLKE